MFVSRRIVTVILMVLTLMILGLGVAVFVALSKASDLGLRISTNQIVNTKALCALRNSKAADAQAGKTFLAKHPRGIPGISVAVIKTNLANERDTIKALSLISCPRLERK